jgi:hypothetical protein
VPLFDMENTYTEYKQWLASENIEIEKSVEDTYKKALNKLQKIQIFEDRLVSFITYLLNTITFYFLNCITMLFVLS